MSHDSDHQLDARTDAGGQPPVERRVFTPPIDIYETEDGLVLCADLPGVSADSLDLQIQDNKLTLFGRVSDTDPEGGKTVHHEYEVGDFLRSFILSDDVDHERISAKMSHGVLESSCPGCQSRCPTHCHPIRLIEAVPIITRRDG